MNLQENDEMQIYSGYFIKKFKSISRNKSLRNFETSKIKKFNLYILLRYFLTECKNNNNSYFFNFLKYSLQIISSNICSIIYNNSLFFCHLHDNKIYLFSQNLNLLKIINIKDLNKISLSGQHNLILKFFPELYSDQKLVLNIKLFSHEQRNEVVKIILPNSGSEAFSNRSSVIVLFEVLLKRKGFLNEIVGKCRDILIESEMLYYPNVYDLVGKSNLIYSNLLKLKSIIFLFTMTSFVRKIYQILFYNINYPKYKESVLEEIYYEILLTSRNHRDSFIVEIKRRIGNKKETDENIHKKFSMSSRLSLKRGIMEEDEESIEKYDVSNYNSEDVIKSRPRHNKVHDMRRSYTNSNLLKKHKVSFSVSALDSFILTKPTYEKISFNVTIHKYIGKEQKVLEICNSGYFMIYKKGKNDNFSSYMFNDIVQLEGDTNSNILNITTLLKDIRKITSVEFSNPYEKYIFKTIVYNFLILSLSRYKTGNQLKLNVNVMTWNIAGIDVPSDLGVVFNSQTFDGIDLFTIGVQECSVFKSKDWQKHLKTLISYYGFEDVTSIDMYQMFLIVFIKRDLRPFVENVCSSYKPMGFAKVIGNKGGIVISFKLMGYQLTFVNCHLAPKPYKVLERNKHVKTLIKSIRLGEKFADFDILADYLFWHGDLNYRVDYTFDETVAEIKKNNISYLLAKDQLLRQKQYNQVFYNFQEPEINFFPTYRRIKGTDEYSNKNDQSPSWCDRIMVKTSRCLDMHYYDSVKIVKHSDHLPVLAKFSIYLTIPSFDDIQKTLNQNVAGKFIYTNLYMSYNFTEAFSELEIEPKFPLKLKLSTHYFINKQPSETKFLEIKNLKDLENICFDELSLNLPPQFIFDLPHSRALNIFFVFSLIIGKMTYEIGFAKYCLENIERDNLHLLIHDQKLDITWRTRKFGTLNFTASYKF